MRETLQRFGSAVTDTIDRGAISGDLLLAGGAEFLGEKILELAPPKVKHGHNTGKVVNRELKETVNAVLHFLQSAIKHVEQYIKSVDHYLRSVSSRDRLVKDICRVLTSDWITFDEDEFLLAFLNKIFDLQRGDWVEPHYSQYISLTTGWKWVGGYSAKYVRELTQLIEQIHPNRDVREHYLTVLNDFTTIFAYITCDGAAEAVA